MHDLVTVETCPFCCGSFSQKYRVHHMLLVQETAAMQVGSPALTCWPSPVVAVGDKILVTVNAVHS
jgi:hypothetical protein